MLQTLLPDEIIVVDASDSDSLKNRLEQKFGGNINIIYNHSTPGLTHQRNVGVGISSGDIVFFLDDDVVLDIDFIKEILKVYQTDKEKTFGGVYGRIINKSPGSHQLASVYAPFRNIFSKIFFLEKGSADGRFRLSGFPTYPHAVDKVVSVECVPGGLTAYRREVLNEFKFDENLHGYCYMEDDDFSYRVSRVYQNVYTPLAKVIHNESPLARDNTYGKMKMLIENHYYLFHKNFPQDSVHRLAFWWSVVGLIVKMFVTLDYRGLNGIFAGLKCIPDVKNLLSEGSNL